MIKYESAPSHFFECLYPPLPPNNKLEWYDHPEVKVKFSNYGTIKNIPGEPECILSRGLVKIRDTSTGYKKFITVAKLEKMMVEARDQTTYGKIRVKHINHNPYDRRIENLIIPTNLNKENQTLFASEEKEFVERSVWYMLQKYCALRDVDTTRRFFQMIGTPVNIMTAFEKALKHYKVI